jgi:acetyl-CoA carboxylase biotin carboxyl carrier protein
VLTFEQIKELIDLVARLGVAGVEVERSGFRLRIEGRAGAAAPASAVAEPLAAAAPAATAAAGVAAPVIEEEATAVPAGAHVVSSPIVGTFYASPSPDADPYVQVGDRVRVGQVLCIVEAMKLMNEIECDVDGVVLAVYPKNAQPVEYGEPLFAVQAD